MTGMLEGVCRINVVSSLVTQSLFTIEADIRLIEINQSQNLSHQNCFSTLNSRRPLKLMTTPVCPRLLNMIIGFVALLRSGLRGFKCHRSVILLLLLC